MKRWHGRFFHVEIDRIGKKENKKEKKWKVGEKKLMIMQ